MTTTVMMSKATQQATAPTRAGYILAWGLCLVFYFLQYALRSAPGVMIPELTGAFGLTTLGVSSLIGLYYYTYAGFAIVSGASLDRWGARMPIVIGVLATASGSVLFGLGGMNEAEGGRLLQGAGSAFAFTGAVFLAVHGFSARWLATAVGVTQLAGMLGGFAGQFAVSPLVHGYIAWQSFWIYAGVALGALAILLVVATPSQETAAGGIARSKTSLWSMLAPYKIVLSNPQSWLCGIVGGLLFMPTTIGDMIWGVPFLGGVAGVSSGEAVARSSMVPLGWVIGAPLLGFIADRIGSRKPPLIGGIMLMLISGVGIAFYGDLIPPYLGGLVFGIGSGAAMIPYTMIKEANPDNVKGSATGAMNFLVFSLSAFLAPVFGLVLSWLANGSKLTVPIFREADLIWGAAILLALVLSFCLRETGSRRNH